MPPGAIKAGGRTRGPTLAPLLGRRPSCLPPLLRAKALGRSRRSSSPERDASARTCGYFGGAASVAQGRAAHEKVLATVLPASICSTTSTSDKSSASARLVVNLVIYNSSRSCLWGENFCFGSPYPNTRHVIFMWRIVRSHVADRPPSKRSDIRNVCM